MDKEKLPVITLWQLWASWVIRGWKTVETRMHDRFFCLEGEWIGIHAGLKWDDMAMDAAMKYLSMEQRRETWKFRKDCGKLLGIAHVKYCGWLIGGIDDSYRALIECEHTKRYGIVFDQIQEWDHIPARGRQGIWYADLTPYRVIKI